MGPRVLINGNWYKGITSVPRNSGGMLLPREVRDDRQPLRGY
jgi:hypothetical protein